MSNSILSVILAILVVVGLVFFFGGSSKKAEAPSTPSEKTIPMNGNDTHVMPDGTIMKNEDASMRNGTHVMPDGTVMSN
jgi:hypothetical protein